MKCSTRSDYGLSYTTFDQKLDSVDVGEDEITAKVTVTNTGDMAGKSVVQLYAQTPYGDYERQHGVEKSAIQLAGFGKTRNWPRCFRNSHHHGGQVPAGQLLYHRP